MIPSCKNLFLNQIANFKSFHESHKLNWKTVVRVFVSYGHEQLGGKKRTKCNNHPWIVFTKRFPKVFSRKRERRCVSKHRGRFSGKTWQNSTKDRGYERERRRETFDICSYREISDFDQHENENTSHRRLNTYPPGWTLANPPPFLPSPFTPFSPSRATFSIAGRS